MSAKIVGVSLTYERLSGPDLYNSMSGILRFRERRIVFGGYIKAMFLKIRIRGNNRWGGGCRDFSGGIIANTNIKRCDGGYFIWVLVAPTA